MHNKEHGPTLPTVHLNGSSRDSLLDDHLAAINALRVALKAVQEIAPHGRDYYTQGPDALAKAVIEHTNRLHRLADTIQELSTTAEYIAWGTL